MITGLSNYADPGESRLPDIAMLSGTSDILQRVRGNYLNACVLHMLLDAEVYDKLDTLHWSA